MYKRKIKVSIVGNTGSNLDIVNQTNQLANNIESYVNNFVGLDTSIKAKELASKGSSKAKELTESRVKWKR